MPAGIRAPSGADSSTPYSQRYRPFASGGELESHLLEELVTIFAVSIGVLLISHRLRIAPIVGLLLTGIVVGPQGLGFVSSLRQIEHLAEIGIVLLMFAIGAELSLQHLLQIRRSVFIGGFLQVGLTWSAGFLLARALGMPVGESTLIGFLLSLSSTALVLKLLQENAEIDSLHGRTAFAILIFQDLIIVPIMLFVPSMGDGPAGGAEVSLWWTLTKSILIMGAVFLASSKLVPKILDLVVGMRDPEAFLLTIVTICFAIAFVTQRAGLSLALGALLAGLIVSESEYSHEAIGKVLPFQQVFTTLFFVSVGMLLDVSYALSNAPLILALTVGVVVAKALLALPAALALGYSLKTALLSALSLAQIGEFSFVLAKEGLRYNALSSASYQLVLSVSILTIALTPLTVALAPRAAELLLLIPWPKRLREGWLGLDDRPHLFSHEPMSEHLIIIGMGSNGRMASRAAEAAEIKYVAIDMNPDRVTASRDVGKPVVYGDATQEAVLRQEGIASAKVAIIAISEPTATRRIVSLIKELNPSCHVIVRTRLMAEVDELYALKADEVVPEEFEAGLQISGRFLRRYRIPRSTIETYLRDLRNGSYEAFLNPAFAASDLAELQLAFPALEIVAYKVANTCPQLGLTLAETKLRNKLGINLIAIRRGATTITNVPEDATLEEDDLVFLLGPIQDHEKLEAFFGARNE